ncbi:hybrid sensor sensor protein, partial [Gloeomargarita lithophora Alchichica-D10]
SAGGIIASSLQPCLPSPGSGAVCSAFAGTYPRHPHLHLGMSHPR